MQMLSHIDILGSTAISNVSTKEQTLEPEQV